MGSGDSHSSLYWLQCVPVDPVSLYLPGLLDSDIYQMEKDIAIEQERNARYRPPKILEPAAFQEPPPKVSQAWASLVLQPQQSHVPLWPNCPFSSTRSWLFYTPLSALDPTTNHPQVSQQKKSGYSTQPMGKPNQELSFRVPCGSLCASGDGRSRARYNKEGECPELLRCRLYVHACSDSLGLGFQDPPTPPSDAWISRKQSCIS